MKRIHSQYGNRNLHQGERPIASIRLNLCRVWGNRAVKITTRPLDDHLILNFCLYDEPRCETFDIVCT
jgi:hypothetical protein